MNRRTEPHEISHEGLQRVVASVKKAGSLRQRRGADELECLMSIASTRD